MLVYLVLLTHWQFTCFCVSATIWHLHTYVHNLMCFESVFVMKMVDKSTKYVSICTFVYVYKRIKVTTVMPVYNIGSNEILKRVFLCTCFYVRILYLLACLLAGLWNETTYYTQRPSNKIIWTNAAAAVRVKQPTILYKILFHWRDFSKQNYLRKIRL